MTTILQLLASMALLGVVTLGAHWWFGSFTNSTVAFIVGAAVLLGIAFLFDRKDARREGKTLLDFWRSPPR